MIPRKLMKNVFDLFVITLRLRIITDEKQLLENGKCLLKMNNNISSNFENRIDTAKCNINIFRHIKRPWNSICFPHKENINMYVTLPREKL